MKIGIMEPSIASNSKIFRNFAKFRARLNFRIGAYLK